MLCELDLLTHAMALSQAPIKPAIAQAAPHPPHQDNGQLEVAEARAGAAASNDSDRSVYERRARGRLRVGRARPRY